jgi:hypothetical protein
MPAVRDLATAQHEAAHVVVGVALGLRLRLAAVGRHRDPEHGWIDGYAAFDKRTGTVEAYATMLAVGVYYERARGGGAAATGDLAALRVMGYRASRIETLVILAGALLESRRGAWARVTAALLERDLGPGDVERLARGESLALAAE